MPERDYFLMPLDNKHSKGCEKYLFAHFKPKDGPGVYGVIEYFFDENEVCYHRYFKEHSKQKFVSLSISNLKNNDPISEFKDDEIIENKAEMTQPQIIVDKLFEIATIQDTVNNVTIKIFPIDD